MERYVYIYKIHQCVIFFSFRATSLQVKVLQQILQIQEILKQENLKTKRGRKRRNSRSYYDMSNLLVQKNSVSFICYVFIKSYAKTIKIKKNII